MGNQRLINAIKVQNSIYWEKPEILQNIEAKRIIDIITKELEHYSNEGIVVKSFYFTQKKGKVHYNISGCGGVLIADGLKIKGYFEYDIYDSLFNYLRESEENLDKLIDILRFRFANGQKETIVSFKRNHKL